MKSPPLLRGTIYNVFCQHVVEENVSRKVGDAIESEVLLESIHYSRNLALHLSTNSLSKLTQTKRSKIFSDAHDSDKFFRDDNLLSAARRSAPVKTGSELSFLHKTLQEYFVAECIANHLLEAFHVEQITPVQFSEFLLNDTGLSEIVSSVGSPTAQMSDPPETPRTNAGTELSNMTGNVSPFFSSPDRTKPSFSDLLENPTSKQKAGSKLVLQTEACTPVSSGRDTTMALGTPPTLPKAGAKFPLKTKGLDRFRKLIQALERCPLNRYEFTSDQEKVSVLDFFLDIMFNSEDFVEHLSVIVSFAKILIRKNASNFNILIQNLKSIVTQKIGRLDGRCLMHEVLIRNSISVFEFCIQVYTELHKEPLSLDYAHAISFLDVQDKFGYPPVYYALTDSGCLLVDRIAPKKNSNQEAYCNIFDENVKKWYSEDKHGMMQVYVQNLQDRGFLKEQGDKKDNDKPPKSSVDVHDSSKQVPRSDESVKVAQHWVVKYGEDIDPVSIANAKNGKSSSQGGYNMDKMIEFIEANRSLFDSANGPIRDSFPRLNTLKRSDLNFVVGLILAVPTSPIGAAPVIDDLAKLFEAAKSGHKNEVIAVLEKNSSLLNSRDIE
jgi:hypothetical protein